MLKKIKNIDSKTLVLSAVTIGGSLEWYEIGLFIFWPLLIEEKPAGFDISIAESVNATAIIILVIMTLLNGATRALGGWFFGKKGDEKGRSIAFPLTLLIATIPSWSLAVLSVFISYESWITYSAVIYTIVKFFQGMPAGGELPGAICYLSETSDLHKKKSWRNKKYMCSFALLGPQIGLALSAIICLILRANFSPEFLLKHAWRYLFIFSGVIGIVGFMMRKKIHETAEYLEFKSHHKVTHEPLKTLFSENIHMVGLAVVLSIFEVVAFSVLSVVPYFYTKAPFNFNPNSTIFLSLGYSILSAIMLPLIGFFSTRAEGVNWFKISVWGAVISSPLLVWSLISGELIFSLFINVFLIFFLSIQAALLPSLLAEIFPTRVRYTGIAFSFNICDGVLWSAFTGISFLFLNHNNPFFILIIPFAAITFLFGIKISKKYNNIYEKIV